GRVGVELAERSTDPSTICKVLWIFAATIKPWRDPFDEMFPLYDRARKLALDVGEHQYANFISNSGIWGRIGRGSNLHDLLNRCNRYQTFIIQSKDVVTVELL